MFREKREKTNRKAKNQDPFAAHHEHMRQMMRSFSDPFGRDPFLSITDDGERTVDRRARQDSQVALRGNHRDDLSIHPDAHPFSSFSVMTYSKVGNEPPKVFQALSQTHTAPGGVKETRKALKDSESGLQKMAIGHHINDRAHVITKSKNSKTGDEEMTQEFINLDENEAQTFDEEWQNEIMKFKPSRTRCTLEAPKYRSTHHVPKGDGLRR
uniref:Uncharacterized protein n=1 Tax=Melopsittacus undulatus TaxID=13146 RepID=A0A8C6K2S9_MELUD